MDRREFCTNVAALAVGTAIDVAMSPSDNALPTSDRRDISVDCFGGDRPLFVSHNALQRNGYAGTWFKHASYTFTMTGVVVATRLPRFPVQLETRPRTYGELIYGVYRDTAVDFYSCGTSTIASASCSDHVLGTRLCNRCACHAVWTHTSERADYLGTAFGVAQPGLLAIDSACVEVDLRLIISELPPAVLSRLPSTRVLLHYADRPIHDVTSPRRD